MTGYYGDLWVFFLLLVGIVLVPGLDMIFVLANSLTGGRAAGMAATAGIMAGAACHIVFSGLAIGSLSMIVPMVAKPMMLAGAAYMVWIGYSLARSRIIVDRIEGADRARIATVFTQGVVTNLLNPKAWLFVLAVLPQFLKPGPMPMWQQVLVLAALCMMVQGTIYGALGLAAAKWKEALLSSSSATIWVGRITGGLLVLAAIYVLARQWPV